MADEIERYSPSLKDSEEMQVEEVLVAAEDVPEEQKPDLHSMIEKTVKSKAMTTRTHKTSKTMCHSKEDIFSSTSKVKPVQPQEQKAQNTLKKQTLKAL